MRWKTVNVNVDVDVDDIIDEIDTDDLKAELESRGFSIEEDSQYSNSIIEDIIEEKTGYIIQALSDEEICNFVLKALGRK